MAEYIERGALKEAFKSVMYDCTCPIHLAAEIDQILDQSPVADVAQVRHGRWLDGKCTVCGWEEPDVCVWLGYDSEAWIETPYCPNCGAIMDGGRL